MMKYARRILLATVFVAVQFVGSANASLFWEFGFVGEVDGFGGSGSFELGGPDTADGLVAYQYSGICNGVACEYGINDVQFSSWSLNEDWTFGSLIITAQVIPEFPLDVTFSSRLQETSLFMAFNNVQTGEDGERFSEFATDTAYLRPVHTNAVPEPATLALLSLGLVGLGMARRKPQA